MNVLRGGEVEVRGARRRMNCLRVIQGLTCEKDVPPCCEACLVYQDFTRDFFVFTRDFVGFENSRVKRYCL